ncbi:unnamed protein product, partial [Ixodes hexagonus]
SFQSCPAAKPGMFNVHILAHTHLDLGWLKTVDQYYAGSKNYLANAGVRYIFDGILPELEKDPSRRFIYVETGFFDMWWKHQSDSIKARFNKLVQSGQLEFISGGWVMNDEAGVHYSNTIDQMTYGIRRLKDNFGDCGIPRIGWQIDPFGHSREYASILAQIGMDGYFFGRLDYQDKTLRQKDKRMEFIWRASENLGMTADIFTGILPSVYSPPSGFCFDVHCGDDPIVDDPESDEYNVPSRLAEFMKYVRKQQEYYKTNNMPVTMGNDFNYQSPPHWFVNLDKLIKYANENSSATNVNLLYSTPSCYLKSLYEANTTWSVKHDDFFPYASDPHSYWTGYFTSRPAFKYLDRYTNNLFQVSCLYNMNAFFSRWGTAGVVYSFLSVTGKALAVGQHHDAITGTAKQAVANNYVKHMSIGLQSSERHGSSRRPSSAAVTFVILPSRGALSFCGITTTNRQELTFYEDPSFIYFYFPTGEARRAKCEKSITPSEDDEHHGFTESTNPNTCILFPVMIKADAILAAINQQEIRFPARIVEVRRESPDFGGVSFACPKSKSGVGAASKRPVEDVRIDPNRPSGLLKAMTWNTTKINVRQSFYWYEGMKGNNTKFEFRASGAYIFRPNGKVPIPIAKKAQGVMVQEVRQIFSDWLTQVIRVYKEEDFIELDWVVGPISVNDSLGKEIVTRFDTDLQSHGDFYTDSNGREILKRTRDYRPTWPLVNAEPVAGNYYPVNSRIYLKDEARDVQFTVLTDRSQGGSSLADGSLEVMVHRRLLHDDAFGVGEALNETYYNGTGLVVRGRHRVLLSPIGEAARMHRSLAQDMYMAPVLAFAPVKLLDYLQAWKTSYSGLAASLPPNVHLLTLEQWNNDTVLLRFEHFYETKDGAGNLSAAANFSLQAIFEQPIADITEMNLAVTKPKEQTSRLEFTPYEDIAVNVFYTFINLGNFKSSNVVSGPAFDIYLLPMQIRTFLVKFSPSSTWNSDYINAK